MSRGTNEGVRARLALAGRDQAAASRAATTLSDLGFEVSGVSARGVDFRSATDHFEKVFGCRVVDQGEELRLEGTPKLPAEISESGASVYLPTRPQFFR